ncbi:MAG: M20/M25/M40 family metallo-hydrolase [Trueperaceae bacterium]
MHDPHDGPGTDPREARERDSDGVAVADADAQRELIDALVRIDSVNPALDPRHDGEDAIARFVQAWAEERGLACERIEPVAGRPSLIVRVPGRAADDRAGGDGPAGADPPRSLMLNAHLDTVGTEGMEAPFAARRDGDRLIGRGTMDMKASLAACLRVAAWAAGRNDLRGDLIVTAVADEDHDSIGTRAVLDHARADMAIVTEPTDLDLHVAHRGFALLELAFEGRASHTSQPERGVNALTHLGRALVGVERLHAALRCGPAHPYVGHGSWQAVLARGGHELFTTPARAEATIERRTVPGESAATGAEAELRDLLHDLVASDPEVRAELRTSVAREAFEAEEDGFAVRAVERAATAVLHGTPRRVGAPYWTDAALLAEAGIPTVLFGPVGGGIHQPDEWVDLPSVERFEATVRQLVLDVCR